MSSDGKPHARALAAAFLVAASLILFQVSFSRLISYKLFYHFVFFAISLSLLGLGAAGTYVALRGERVDAGAAIRRWLAWLVVSVPVAFLLIANPFGVTHHPPIRTKLLGGDAIVYLLWCAPLMVWLNFCGGVVLTTLFARHSRHMGSLYAADLLGAGAGSLLALGVMKLASPPAAFVCAVIPLAIAWAAFALPRLSGEAIGVAGAIALCAGIFLGPSRLRDFQNFRTEGGAHRKVLKYEWNHLIRTDHVPGWYVLDGDAATSIVAWNERERRTPPRTPLYAVAKKQPTVAIIGVGGGQELSEALRAGASSVLAIDINPSILSWALGKDRKLNHDLYLDPRVEVRLDEGRHAVRSAKRRFDAIVMHAIDTYSAAAAGAYALTENFLYTKEAFQDYYRALSDRGVLSISRWLFYPPREDLRLFHTALHALRDLGVGDPRGHLVMVAPLPDYEKLGDRRVWGYLLMSRSAFTADDVRALQAHAQRQHWSVLYAPGVRTKTPFYEVAHSPDIGAFQRDYPYLISPVTDASPYLFQFYNPLHRTSYRPTGDWATANIYQGSAITLLVALLACTVVSFVLILAPLLLFGRARSAGARSAALLAPREALYFAGLGVGYMALEVPIIQVLSMYLGHPTYGFAVVLVALLIATGLGSLAVERLDAAPRTVCAAIAALLVLVTATALPLAHATLDLPAPVRFAIAIALVAGCGFPMGMPLALAVRALGRRDPRSVAWAWGVNGAASVVGACLVMIALVFAGAYAAFALGGLCYASAAVAWPGAREVAGDGRA